MKIAVISLVSFLLFAGVFFFRAGKAVASSAENDREIQQMLIALTENMRVLSEASKVEFKIWADLNDAILESVTNYYNGSKAAEKFETTKNIINDANLRVQKIHSENNKDRQKQMLLEYLSELKTNNRFSADSALSAPRPLSNRYA